MLWAKALNKKRHPGSLTHHKLILEMDILIINADGH